MERPLVWEWREPKELETPKDKELEEDRRTAGEKAPATGGRGQGQEGTGTSLVGPWLRIGLARQGTWLPPLVRELGSHMPLGS